MHAASSHGRSSAASTADPLAGGIRRQTIDRLAVRRCRPLSCTALFVLQPLALTVQYSLYRWDGVGPSTWVGLRTMWPCCSEPKLVETLFNAFRLVVFYSFIPVALGLVTASVIHRVAAGRLGTVSRTVLFLPQVIPLVAAGIIWGRLLSLTGLINQALTAIGLGDVTRAWLGDFDTALPAVGLIGIWVLLGFCTVLLLTGMSRIDTRAVRVGPDRRRGMVPGVRSITLPSLRNEIGVCITVTVIAALAAFDIVYVTTGGGPGNATAVPGHPDLHPCLPRAPGRARHRRWRSSSWPWCSSSSCPSSGLPGGVTSEGRAIRAVRRSGVPHRPDRHHGPAIRQHLHDRAPSIGIRAESGCRSRRTRSGATSSRPSRSRT